MDTSQTPTQADRIEAKLDALLAIANDLRTKAESFELPPMLKKMFGGGS